VDIALKQRLVGASVLIALAIIILPMLLGGRPEDGSSSAQRIEIPEQPRELDFETRRFPVGDSPQQARPPVPEDPLELPAPSRSDALTAEDAEAATRSDRGVAYEPPPGSAAAETGKTEPMEQPPSGTEPATEQAEPPVNVVESEPVAPVVAQAGGRYVVQVASFRSADNARRLSGQLTERGYGVQSDSVTSDVGTLHRVRVGPFATEEDAGRAVTELSRQLSDVSPRVVDLKPESGAPAMQPSDPLVRWVVQVGSFSSARNAENLVAKLRLEGLTAYQESVSGSSGTIHRVRVGPFIERDEALRVDRLVNERLSIDGVVMSAD
jgi:DedD protein